MATHYIGLYATIKAPDTLKILDDEGNLSGNKEDDKNLTTDVLNGDTIVWKIINLEHNAIATIDKIEINSNAYFDPGPTPVGDGTWSAVVNDNSEPSIYGDGFSAYTIYYIDKNGDKYSQDPKIRLRPSIGS
jgi:hypothetical protein